MFSVEDEDGEYDGEDEAEETGEPQVYPDEEDDVRAGVRFEDVPVLSDSDSSDDDKAPNATRKTRSGRSYYSIGVKYRPTDRNRTTTRLRYGQAYLQRKKSKINLLTNRSAMRKKARRDCVSLCTRPLRQKLNSGRKECRDDDVLGAEVRKTISEQD